MSEAAKLDCKCGREFAFEIVKAEGVITPGPAVGDVQCDEVTCGACGHTTRMPVVYELKKVG